MSPPDKVQEANQALAYRINEEARRNRQSQYAGKFVGLVDGQVLVTADDLDELVRRLQQAEADPSRTLCIEVGLDYDKVQGIWKAR